MPPPAKPVNLLAFKPTRGTRLGRSKEKRIILLNSMITYLIEHERITTTLGKAKHLSEYAEGVINLAKKASPAAYDKATEIIRTDAELHKLFTTLALRYHHRPSHYTRVVPTGFRFHDGAPMAIIEFVDRAGEIRPASRPLSQRPFLPAAAVAYLRQAAGDNYLPAVPVTDNQPEQVQAGDAQPALAAGNDIPESAPADDQPPSAPATDQPTRPTVAVSEPVVATPNDQQTAASEDRQKGSS